MKFRPLAVLVILMGLPVSAFAYIDPGSGMLLWQGLIAGVGMVLVFVRHPLKAIKRLIERLRDR